VNGVVSAASLRGLFGKLRRLEAAVTRVRSLFSQYVESRGSSRRSHKFRANLGRTSFADETICPLGLSSAEMASEIGFIKPISYVSGRRVFPSGRGFHRGGQAGVELACQALGGQEIANLDQIA